MRRFRIPEPFFLPAKAKIEQNSKGSHDFVASKIKIPKLVHITHKALMENLTDPGVTG